MTYIEGPADAAFTAFLASLTPGRVLRNRSAMFSKSERKLDRYLRAKTKSELEQIRQSEIYVAIQMAHDVRQGLSNKKAS